MAQPVRRCRLPHDKQSKQAAAALSEYTVALQTDLKTAGYLQGAVDGI
jgi:hypothetical protein